MSISDLPKKFNGLYELISLMDRPPDILCIKNISTRIKNTLTINIDLQNYNLYT